VRLAPGDRLLIRLPNWLGDALMAEPAVSALAERVGPAHVTLAGPGPLLELLGSGGGELAAARRAGREPGPAWKGHDAAVLLTNSWRSALGAWRARIPVRAGWSRGGRGVLLTLAVTPPREVGRTPLGLGRPGRVPRYLPRPFGAAAGELAAWLGAPVRRTRPRLALPIALQSEARERAAARRAARAWTEAPYALLNAGARPGSAKGYPPAAWTRVASLLLAEGLPVVVAAGPGEEAALAEMRAALGPGALFLSDPPADLAELAAWVAGADVVLTADGGPRHLAVALERPLVVVAGPTDPRHTADHLERTELLRARVPCGPCHRERCPLDGPKHHACMTRVAPEAVARAALELRQAWRR
jgi:heptosyltransferase-2